jgi:hypothetical protein
LVAGDVDSITIGGFTWNCMYRAFGVGCSPALSACSIDPPMSTIDPTFVSGSTLPIAPLNATLPEAIGRLSCRSKITRMCAR